MIDHWNFFKDLHQTGLNEHLSRTFYWLIFFPPEFCSSGLWSRVWSICWIQRHHSENAQVVLFHKSSRQSRNDEKRKTTFSLSTSQADAESCKVNFLRASNTRKECKPYWTTGSLDSIHWTPFILPKFSMFRRALDRPNLSTRRVFVPNSTASSRNAAASEGRLRKRWPAIYGGPSWSRCLLNARIEQRIERRIRPTIGDNHYLNLIS